MFDEAEARALRIILLSETPPMKLYFLRHAEAEDGAVDELRKLTVKGQRDTRRLGKFLSKVGVEVDLAFTSPLVRAHQTAAGVLKECRLPRKARLEKVETLTNGTSSAGFFRWLKSLPEVESVLLVGHEPSLSVWLRQMLGLARADGLPLAKGAIARVDTDDRKSGTLRMLISPKWIA